ncbi:MAG TPA: hypothetical protein VGC66_06685 [Pyrinomonadaceae bacterium]|jgi:hypothetical protein
MQTQTIIWTALPNGRDGRKLHLSVFVSPRLKTNEGLPRPELKQFDDFNRWPEKVSRMKFAVQFDTGALVDAERTSNDPQMQLWRDIFKERAYVRPYQFKKQTHRVIRTYPVRSVLEYLKSNYRRIAENSPVDLPFINGRKSGTPEASLQSLIDDLGGIIWQNPRRLIELERTLFEQKAFDPRSTQTYGWPSKLAFDFYQANRFYDRPEMKSDYRAEPDLLEVPPPPELPELDFHQALASLADYPVLLRRLGMVIDLTVRDPGAPFNAIRIKPTWEQEVEPASAFNRDFTPWTMCSVTPELFSARPRPASDLGDGMLKLERSNDQFEPKSASVFDLVQVDADGAVLKVLNFAGNMRRLNIMDDDNRAALNTPDDAGLPSLRSAGIAVIRSGRAYNLSQTFQAIGKRNSLAEDNTPPVQFRGEKIFLYADDLVRGYRVDVLDVDNNDWFSLCQRQGRYRIVDDDGNPVRVLEDDTSEEQDDTWIEDEGYIKGASTTSKDAEASDLYLHETLLRWDGWSVCAERPGKTIKPVRAGLQQDEVPEKIPNRAATEFKLETEFKATPNTLPRLRYGKRYQMRARTVDLAGNSLPPDTTDAAHASEEIFYTRFEPIIPPAVVPRLKFTEGESVEQMVIRSNYDQRAAAYVASDPIRDFHYQESNERHLVPPKTSQLMAETHDMFEAFFGQNKDYDLGYRIALKEAGTLMDDRVIDISKPLDLVTKQPATVAVTGKDVIVNPTDPQAGQYVVHDTDELLLPYLPDPLARGVSMRGLPGLSETGTPELDKVIDPARRLQVLKIPFEMNWPDSLPFRIRIVERPGGMEAADCSETFEHAEDPPVWDKRERVLTVFLAKAQVAKVRYSCYPGRDRNGIKDIRQMGIWQWLRSSPRRNELEFFIEAGAHWMLTPFRELVLVHAVQQPLCEPRIDFKQFSSQKSLIGDTFASLSGLFHLSVKSTGRIDLLADWEMWVDDLTDPAPKRVKGAAHVCERKIEDYFPDDLYTYRMETIRHEFGDTKYRSVQYHLLGTTRFREYFSPEITADPKQITRSGPVREIPIRNSARPAAPKVLYIVPSFRWDEESSPPHAPDWENMKKRRTGGGLRVYMDRPWYSSGDEELLGVVLPPSPLTPRLGYSDKMKPYVTQIGVDPLWTSETTGLALTPDGFHKFTAAQDNLSLEELGGGQKFTVVGFTPEYNHERRLWYCDIQFAPQVYKSYYPFVRLALVRFQPNSIADAHLSRVVLADFAQLAPDRSLGLVFRDEKSFTASMVGFAYSNPSVRVEFTIEEHDDKIPGEFGWRAIAATGSQPNPVRVDPLAHPPGEPLHWQTTMHLPQPRGTKSFRLIVKEYEPYTADITGGMLDQVSFMVERPLDYRLVFAGEVRL